MKSLAGAGAPPWLDRDRERAALRQGPEHDSGGVRQSRPQRIATEPWNRKIGAQLEGVIIFPAHAVVPGRTMDNDPEWPSGSGSNEKATVAHEVQSTLKPLPQRWCICHRHNLSHEF